MSDLREALAATLLLDCCLTSSPAEARAVADALLAGPLADLLAKVQAVEALADEWGSWRTGFLDREDALMDLRRALDGTR